MPDLQRQAKAPPLSRLVATFGFELLAGKGLSGRGKQSRVRNACGVVVFR